MICYCTLFPNSLSFFDVAIEEWLSALPYYLFVIQILDINEKVKTVRKVYKLVSRFLGFTWFHLKQTKKNIKAYLSPAFLSMCNHRQLASLGLNFHEIGGLDEIILSFLPPGL